MCSLSSNGVVFVFFFILLLHFLLSFYLIMLPFALSLCLSFFSSLLPFCRLAPMLVLSLFVPWLRNMWALNSYYSMCMCGACIYFAFQILLAMLLHFCGAKFPSFWMHRCKLLWTLFIVLKLCIFACIILYAPKEMVYAPEEMVFAQVALGCMLNEIQWVFRQASFWLDDSWLDFLCVFVEIWIASDCQRNIVRKYIMLHQQTNLSIAQIRFKSRELIGLVNQTSSFILYE